MPHCATGVQAVVLVLTDSAEVASINRLIIARVLTGRVMTISMQRRPPIYALRGPQFTPVVKVAGGRLDSRHGGVMTQSSALLSVGDSGAIGSLPEDHEGSSCLYRCPEETPGDRWSPFNRQHVVQGVMVSALNVRGAVWRPGGFEMTGEGDTNDPSSLMAGMAGDSQ
jgi:hypothetical protein